MVQTASDGYGADTQRGQVGIGTLIIFIAMVLVAVIAAGVLVGVADNLQSQAEATGEESTAKVSNNINVITTTGTIDDESGDIETIDMTVALKPGSSPMDLENFVLEYLGPNGKSYFLDDDLQVDVDGSSNSVLESGADRGTITLELDDTETLEAGDEATMLIITNEGAQRTERLVVPTDLEDEQTVRL